jgi:hypothetical protein
MEEKKVGLWVPGQKCPHCGTVHLDNYLKPILPDMTFDGLDPAGATHFGQCDVTGKFIPCVPPSRPEKPEKS